VGDLAMVLFFRMLWRGYKRVLAVVPSPTLR
jgi:hypothetical protein